MRVRFVSRGSLEAFRAGHQFDGEELLLFGFEGMGEVSYEKELKGESGHFEEAALLSKSIKGVVVCGCVTDTRGHKRKSAVVAENGRLCGVSDMLHSIDGEIGAGAALRIYETKIGKMGLVVGEDVYFVDLFQSLALFGADFIVCPFGAVKNSMHAVLLRAYAYLFGLPILFCGAGHCCAVGASGEIEFSSPNSPITIDFEKTKEYHLIETRRRGYFGER